MHLNLVHSPYFIDLCDAGISSGKTKSARRKRVAKKRDVKMLIVPTEADTCNAYLLYLIKFT